jgi:acylphosphatase
MNSGNSAVKIIVSGVVQGVGYRYFIARAAGDMRLTGYAKNLFNGDVEIHAEGETGLLHELVKAAKLGPPHSHVTSCKVEWLAFTNKYDNFEIF